MKQVFSLFIAAGLLLTMLTGCAQNTAAGSTIPSPSADNEAKTETVGGDTAEDLLSPEQEDAAEDLTAPEQGDTAEDLTAPEQEDTAQLSFDTVTLTVERGTMVIQSGEAFLYCREDGTPADYTLTDGTLSIQQTQDHKTVLTLPVGEYTAISLTVGEGHLYAECTLSLQNLELYVTQGEVTLDSVSVTDSSKIEVRQGSASLSGELGVSVTAKSEMGHLDMAVSSSQSSYNISMELSEGSIRLGGETYHDRTLSKTIDNGAEQSMSLTCSKGDLAVAFDLK